MTKIWQKLAAATAGAILSFAALEANPAQAAVFNFFSEGQGRLFGDLVFNDATSGLTGIGSEEASLSQLKGIFGFSYEISSLPPNIPKLQWGEPADILSTPIFSFESGNLVGMNFDLAPKKVTWVHPRGIAAWIDTGKLFIQGSTYRVKQSQVTRQVTYRPFCESSSYPWPCGTVVDVPSGSTESTGQINFVTRVPFKRPTSVPEPGSVVGLSLLGLAFLLKQKTASSQG
ncbi:PEP-CTERM sorting domain-containing protein [Microseira wollei]|uniref:PEP-CTERM protein-sorting domain-containing protein n=1 Tax=Microseira wollei NIES-4236 TaxID=2530354 RepID=A0AAV3X5J7_9CYAN|nr:PEP-CTERM sorting domain-containing protein [Microseira wollei]GET35467.1 hypothetical protein MiSe_02090 [Microseira wollei NIES-4236]